MTKTVLLIWAVLVWGCTVSPRADHKENLPGPHDSKIISSPTTPDKATNPNPPDGAVSVSPDLKPSWQGPPAAVSYRVYFGTVSPPPYQTTNSQTVYDPGPLDWGKTYYWRVDIVDGPEGDTWSFTTFWYGDPQGEEMDM